MQWILSSGSPTWCISCGNSTFATWIASFFIQPHFFARCEMICRNFELKRQYMRQLMLLLITNNKWLNLLNIMAHIGKEYFPCLAHSIVVSTIHISWIESMIRGRWQMKNAETMTRKTIARWSSKWRRLAISGWEVFSGRGYRRALRIWNWNPILLFR